MLELDLYNHCLDGFSIGMFVYKDDGGFVSGCKLPLFPPSLYITFDQEQIARCASDAICNADRFHLDIPLVIGHRDRDLTSFSTRVTSQPFV